MQNKFQRIGYLILKSRNKELTLEEQTELEIWLNQNLANRNWYDGIIQDEDYWKENIKWYDEAESLRKGSWEKLSLLIREASPEPRVYSMFKRWRVAASILLLVAAGATYILYPNKTKTPQPANTLTNSIVRDIPPGSNKAILTLANGSVIQLSDAAKGVLAEQGNTKIEKLGDGALAYHPNDGKENSSAFTGSNTVSTPRGGQYMIVLPDNSKVWLNSASSITYPTAFTGKDRTVRISGEVYFEIAKDRSRPFHVSAGNLGVDVLGTRFNIDSYADENTIKTTLLDGSVKVSGPQSSIIIKPGQQAQVAGDKIAVVDGLDMEGVMAWKNGHFHFENADIQSVMRDLARWYDFQVVYDGAITNDRFSGDIQRNLMFSQLIDILGDNIHYSIEGKKIIVKP